MKKKFFNEGKLTQTGRLMVIVIVGALCILAGMGLFDIINDHVVNKKKNAELAQKIEIALLRLSKEFHAIQSISAASDKTITYKRQGAIGQETHTVSWTTEDQPITIDGDTLIDHVKSFRLKYYDKFDAAPSNYSSSTLIIEFTMEIKDHNSTPHIFVNRVVI
jgi:hypothetical protein